MNLTGTPLCHPSDIPPDGIKNKAVVVQWGSCHVLEKAQIAQKGGAEALLIANSSVLVSAKWRDFYCASNTKSPRNGVNAVCVPGAE